MPYVLVRHTVADYAKWKSAYDEPADTRKANGSKGSRLFRNANNPHETFILFEWDGLEKARQITQSEELRQAMQRAGVTDTPDIH